MHGRLVIGGRPQLIRQKYQASLAERIQFIGKILEMAYHYDR
jgi:hypothetical protein